MAVRQQGIDGNRFGIRLSPLALLIDQIFAEAKRIRGDAGGLPDCWRKRQRAFGLPKKAIAKSG